MDLAPFRHWLISRGYSSSTVRNYLADTNRYLSFAKTNPPFSSDLLNAYLQNLSTDSNAKRYLASLNKFCQYALDQRLVSHNPLKKLQKQPKNTVDDLLQQYQKHLEKHKVSPVTIKNYIGDIKQFMAWTSN